MDGQEEGRGGLEGLERPDHERVDACRKYGIKQSALEIELMALI